MAKVKSKNKLNSPDRLMLFLSFGYLLHEGLPYISLHTPAAVWAGLVVALFLFTLVRFAKYENIIRYLVPILGLFLMDVFFVRLKGISTPVEAMQLMSSIMQVMVLPMMAGYVIKTRNTRLACYLMVIYVCLMFVTCITSIVAESVLPGIIRVNNGVRGQDAALYTMKTNLNVGDFNLVYGCVVLVPIGILAIKYMKELFGNLFLKSIFVLFFVVLIYLISVAQFSTALVVTMGLLMTVFLPKKMNLRLFRGTLVMASIVGVIAYTVLPVLLNFVADNVESKTVAARFEGTARALEGDANSGVDDVEKRKETYELSFTAIQNTFPLGSWNVKVADGQTFVIGGHSFIFDNIAVYGVVGLFLLFVYYKALLRLFYRSYRDKPWVFFFLYGLIATTIFYIMNPAPFYKELLFCYPLTAFLINHKLERYGA